MDFLSIAGFALNVASYLKENPLEFAQKEEEPVAISRVDDGAGRGLEWSADGGADRGGDRGSRALADISLALPKEPPAASGQERRYPQGVSGYQKRTQVDQEGQIRLVRATAADAAASREGVASAGQPPLTQQPDSSRSPIESGLNRNGQYFFRKRGL